MNEFKRVRMKLGLTVAEFADLLGYADRYSVYKLDAGDKQPPPRLARLLRMIDAFGLPPGGFSVDAARRTSDRGIVTEALGA